MADPLIRLVILMQPEEVARIDRYWHSEAFVNRSEAIRDIFARFLTMIETGEMPERAGDPQAAPSAPMQDPHISGNLPGEHLPDLRKPEPPYDAMLPLLIQKLQKHIDATGRIEFEDTEIARVVFGDDAALPLKHQLISVEACMSNLKWHVRTDRKGRPRGQPGRIWSYAPA